MDDEYFFSKLGKDGLPGSLEGWFEPFLGKQYLVVGSCAEFIMNTSCSRYRYGTQEEFDFKTRDVDIFIPKCLSNKIEDLKRNAPRNMTVDIHALPDELFDLLRHKSGSFIHRQVAGTDLTKAVRLAHLHRDWNWFKNAKTLIKEYNGDGFPSVEPQFEALYAYWTDYDNDKRINLNKTNEEFFSDNVSRIYEHDSIHEAIASTPLDGRGPVRPMYEHLKQKGKFGNAWTGDLLSKLSKGELHRLMMEEIWVVAIERFILTGKQPQPSVAKVYAYKHLLTSMTKGEFRKALVKNFFAIITDNADYYGRFLRNQHKLVLINKGEEKINV